MQRYKIVKKCRVVLNPKTLRKNRIPESYGVFDSEDGKVLYHSQNKILIENIISNLEILNYEFKKELALRN